MEYESKYPFSHTDQLYGNYIQPQQIYFGKDDDVDYSSSDINHSETSSDYQRRLSQDGKSKLAILTLTSLGAVGGLMASKVFSSGKPKQRPPKQMPVSKTNPPASAPNTGYSAAGTRYQEVNYTQYTHGSNVNAHLKPITYSKYSTNSSLVANAGSTATSITSTAATAGSSGKPSTLKLQRVHGYGGANNAQNPSMATISEDQKKSRRRWSHQATIATSAAAAAAAAAAATATVTAMSGSSNNSYQAFDHSAGQQPQTSSVLAQPSSSRHRMHQQTGSPNHSPAASAASPAYSAAPAAYTAGGTAQSTAWSHEAVGPGSSRPATSYYPSATQRTDVAAAPSIAPSVLESDIANAGFTSMPSMYDPKKSSNKNKHGTSAQAPPSAVSAAPAVTSNNGYHNYQQQHGHHQQYIQSHQNIPTAPGPVQYTPGHPYTSQQQINSYMPQPIPIPYIPAHTQPSQPAHNYEVSQQPSHQVQYAQQQPYAQQHQYHPGYQNHHQPLQPSYQHEHNHHHQSQQLSHSMSQSAPVIYSSMPQLGHGEMDYYSSMPHYGSQPMGSNNGAYARPKKQVHFAE